MIEDGETVTWEAKHFGIRQRLSVRITRFDRPNLFADEMESGAFAAMSHTHKFASSDGITVMTDEFQFSAPLGILGRIAEALFLTRYMRTFLKARAAELKAMAESDEWHRYLPATGEQAQALNP